MHVVWVEISRKGGYEDLRDMGNIMKTSLPLPGAPGQWASLEEMYYPDGPPVG